MIHEKTFKNSSKKGAFGEFCYQKFAEQKGFEIEKAGIIEVDFIISSQHYVDVKTTESGNTRYEGKRFGKNISYDVISIRDGVVKIYPDYSSPLANWRNQEVGKLGSLLVEWDQHKWSRSHSRLRGYIKAERKALEDRVKGIVRRCGFEKIRFVFRGSVSKTRWTASPDNLPGTDSVIERYDLTVFIQMRTDETREKIEKIMVFPHDCLHSVRMKDSDKRQKNKGITKVIDLDWFQNGYPDYVFESIEQFENGFAACMKNQSLRST